ncbi:MAG TPA: ATP synthase F1 subunit delta [Pyrinomonadaceae bacterium]
MSLQTIARRYATALADVVIEHAEASEVQAELRQWEAMLQQNPELREVFANPTIVYDQKRAVLRELINRAKVRPTTANFLQLLLKNQRLTELPEINARFEKVLDVRAGIVAAAVITARPVSADIREAIQGKLKGLTGKQIRVDFQTDTDIIGGLVTKIGSTIYDGSIRTQLELLSTRLAHN